MYAAEAEYLAAGGPEAADFTPLAPFFSPDVVLRQADTLPYGGTWRGHEGIERFFMAMSRTWDIFEMVDQQFLSTTSPLVVLTKVHARARSTGRELDFPILQTIAVETPRSPRSTRSTGTPPPSRARAHPTDRTAPHPDLALTARSGVAQNRSAIRVRSSSACACRPWHGPLPDGCHRDCVPGRPRLVPNLVTNWRIYLMHAGKAGILGLNQ